MREKRPRAATRVIGYLLCSGLIGIAGTISYYNPFTVITLTRVGDRQVDADLKYYMLFFIPIGQEGVEDVREVVLHHHSRSDASLELKTAGGRIQLASGYVDESAINEFLSDRTRSTYTVRAASHLIFVVFLGGIGSLFLTIAVIGDFVRLLQLLNIVPRSSNAHQRLQPDGVGGALPESVSSAMDGSVGLSKVVAWRPGELIHIKRPNCGIPVMLFILCFGGILGAVIGFSFLGIMGGAIGAGVGSVGFVVFLLAKAPSRELRIDWRTGVIWWREGVRSHSRELRDLQAVLLRPVFEDTQRSRNQKRVREYRSQMDLNFGQRTAPVIDTDLWRRDASTAKLALQPLAGELARALGVPLRNEPAVAQLSVWGELKRRPVSIPGFIVGVAGCAVVTGVLWLGRGIAERSAAESVVAEIGGSITTLSSSVSNTRILDNATEIEFETAIGDEQLATLAPVLPRFRKIKLVLSESSVTDAGLGYLAGVKQLKSLDLGKTSISARGLEQIAKITGLVELNLTGCPVNDEGVAHLTRLPVLRVLYLTHTEMSDAGLNELAKVTSLDYLSVGFSSVTKLGVERLRKQLPHTEIRAIGPGFRQ